MTDAWDGRPQNSERDGYHWLLTPEDVMVVFEWQAVGFSEEGHWPSRWLFDPATDYDPRDCQYLGPCLTLAEVAAREAAAFKRGAEAMREAAARLLQYHAARLRKDDEDNRGIPAGMGHSFEANAGDAWAAAIRALSLPEDKTNA